MEKIAVTQHAVHDLIARRWSPRAFDPSRTPSREMALSMLEAARWAPSAYNEQPWRFIAALRGDREGYERLLECLVPQNAAWARDAGLLVVALYSETFALNGKPNRWATHDLGLAVENLLLQATGLGLFAHPMAGFSPEKVRELCAVPEGVTPLVMIAVGYPAEPGKIPEALREGELAERTRRPLALTAFNGRWGAGLDS